MLLTPGVSSKQASNSPRLLSGNALSTSSRMLSAHSSQPILAMRSATMTAAIVSSQTIPNCAPTIPINTATDEGASLLLCQALARRRLELRRLAAANVNR